MPNEVVNKGGRPSTFDIGIANEICARVATGDTIQNLTKNALLPAQSTVYKWITLHPEFGEMLRQARADYAVTLVDQYAEIMDKEPATFFDQQGNKRVDPASVQDKKLRMEGRKWLAGKYNTLFADRTATEKPEVEGQIVDVMAKEIVFTLVKNYEMKRQVVISNA
jgi:hypothetical protein